jgi:hypothetical protein
MTVYQIDPATSETLAYIAEHMSKADREEVWAASHSTPLEALQKSMDGSSKAWVGLADGVPFCAFGVASSTLLSDVGVPWLLGTEDVPKHARVFLRVSKSYIHEQARWHKLLVNYVDARHARAVKWLRWLGFTMYPAEPFGPDQVPFHRFEMRA